MMERVFAACAPGIIDGGFDVPDGVGLYRATSASKARYLGYLSARDADFNVCLTDVKVRRWPSHDRAQFVQGSMPSFARFPAPETPIGEVAS